MSGTRFRGPPNSERVSKAETQRPVIEVVEAFKRDQVARLDLHDDILRCVEIDAIPYARS